MQNLIFFCLIVTVFSDQDNRDFDDDISIEIFDLTHPTRWKDLATFYGAIEKRWKICVNCGIPGLGTVMHMEHVSHKGSMQPAIVPSEYLLTRLVLIDVSYLTRVDPGLVLSLDVALQWPTLKRDPKQPTLLLFKFGWVTTRTNLKGCICKIPGLSYELAHYIATNLTHVVGVASDAPTLESEETREMTTRTVANVLGKSGIYVIENINLRNHVPERGCMSLAMPLKLLDVSYVPTRLTVFCPSQKTDRFVTIALKKSPVTIQTFKNDTEINLSELLSKF